MDSPSWNTLYLSLLFFLLCIQITLCVEERLLSFDATSAQGFLPSLALVLDKDGNGRKPTVTEHENQILVRTDTMPQNSDPQANLIREDNYVFLPYMENPTSNEMLVVRYTFVHEQPCPDYILSGVQCMNDVTLQLVEATATQDVSTISLDTPLWSEILTTNNPGSDVERRRYAFFTPSVRGYRLVLHDQGSSFLLKLVTVNRYYCQYPTQSTHQLTITCPDSAATSNRHINVQCHCRDPNSEPNTGRATISEECVYNPDTYLAYYERSSADNGASCDCKPGTEYSVAENGTRYCKVLPTTANQNSPTATSIQPDRSSSSTTATPPGSTPTRTHTATTDSASLLQVNKAMLAITLPLTAAFACGISF